jgi:hypothetical protein
VVRKKRRAKENERAKEVEPDGHGEATRGHELHLHELASVVPRLSFSSSPTELGHEWLARCGYGAHRHRVHSGHVQGPNRITNDRSTIESTKHKGMSYTRHYGHGGMNPRPKCLHELQSPRLARRLGPHANKQHHARTNNTTKQLHRQQLEE